MSNALKKYKREVKLLFGKTSISEETMLQSFFTNIDDYENIEKFTYNELVEQFGKPEDIFCTNIELSSNKVLIQKKSYLKNNQRLILGTLIFLFIFTSVFIFKAYLDSKQSYIEREQIEIIQDN